MSRQRLYVGSYTRSAPHVPGARGRGIYTLDFDFRTGTLAALRLAAELDNPSFLVPHPNGRALYAVSELGEGVLSAFSIVDTSAHASSVDDSSVDDSSVDENSVGQNGALRFLNAQPTLGSAAVYVSADSGGRRVFVANYGGGASVAAFPIFPDGSVGPCAASARHEGRGPNAARQAAPHAHAVLPAPDGAFAHVCDLGTDEVAAYHLGEPDSPLRRAGALTFPGGSGPRSIAFHPSGRLAFVTLELTSRVASLRRVPETGELCPLHTVAAQPPDFTGENSPAEVQVSPCGRFVYASNRGHDSIGAWEVDERTGRLTCLGHWPTLGKTPRSFTFSPDGAFLLAANQDGDSIAVFARDPQSGRLRGGQVFACPTPACLRF